MGLLEAGYTKSPIFFQNLLLNAKAAELYFERYGKKFWKTYHNFEKNQWLSEGELTELQNRKLKKLIKHAYHSVPYYNKVMTDRKLIPADIKTIGDLNKLPVLTKRDIQNNFKQLISKASKKLFLRHGHTSGTTGSPLDLCYDISACVVHHAADWRQKSWAGLNYGEPYASIQGRVIVPVTQKKPPFWRKNYINNQLFLSSFHLKEENIKFYFDKLSKDKIKFLEGYPSTIYILALYLQKHNIKYPLKAVFTSSETLFDFQREVIEKYFCCRIFDFYGMAERVIYATECNHHSGHHINSDYGITEFLDGSNNPVEKGELGSIVATGLSNFAMPLIRYRTNDSCSLKNEKCSCGRGFPLMDEVATKNESILKLIDGRLISPSVLTHPFKPLNGILESQIIQDEIDHLTINLVISDKYNKNAEKQLIDSFKYRLGNNIKITIKYLDSIPRTKTGKFRWVISEIYQ